MNAMGVEKKKKKKVILIWAWALNDGVEPMLFNI